MTSRNSWKPGVGIRILDNDGGFSPEGFGKYKENGIPYAELSLRHNELENMNFYEKPEILNNLANSSGVEFWSFHIPFGNEINPAILNEKESKEAMAIMEKGIRAAAKIGIQTMVIHPSAEPNKPEERREKMKKSIENMKILSDLCRSLGAVLAVEDLPRTCLGNCSDEIIEFLDAIPSLMLCYDTNHLTVQKNSDFLNALIEHGLHGRIRTIHVSDYDGIDEKHRLPFDGVNDWKDILSKLEMLDYNGVFMYEVDKAWDRDKPYTVKDVAQNFEKMMKL